MSNTEIIVLVAVVAWIALSFLVAARAKAYGRAPLGWFAISVILTPLVAFGVLLVSLARQQQADQQEKNDGPTDYVNQPTDVLDTAHYERKCPKCGADGQALLASGPGR